MSRRTPPVSPISLLVARRTVACSVGRFLQSGGTRVQDHPPPAGATVQPGGSGSSSGTNSANNTGITRGDNRRTSGLAEGPGIWINMWNYPTQDYEAYAQKLYASGIRNLFAQTSRSNTDAIAHPTELGQLIDACHKYKIRVIAWSFTELGNPGADADRMIAAANVQISQWRSH